ncbi:MAG: ATP-binding protein [Endomicrobia bacterium]|nr:ATP-binding protein [Endomicrobiia bacterium]
MTIRQKLRTIFFIFIGLIFGLILWLVLSLYLQQKNFIKYVEMRDRLGLLETIVQTVASQKLRFDYYILLQDDNEKENFILLSNQLKKIINLYFAKTPHTKIKQKYEDLLNTAERVFNEKNLVKKINMAMNDFFLSYEAFIESVNKEKNDFIKQISTLQRNIQFLYIFSWIFSSFIIFISLFVSFNYGIKIYNSLIKPLKVIVEFANILSKGDYRTIDFSTKDEFSEVISTFNHMVNSLKTLQAQILQMDRLSNIGQLAGGIAHELNNPLVGVLGQAQILLEKLPSDSPLREHVEKIERAALRCKENISILLKFSRQKEYEYTEVDINEIIRSVLFIADSELKANNIEVINISKENLPKLKVSVPHIQQAFLNIINNAIQAITENDTSSNKKNFIKIKTYITKLDEDNKEYIAVEFQDSGCGIEKENFKLIFEPFFTTKNKNKFAGMGLSITKDIILHHKGKITVMSEGRNKGATFVVYLPLSS